MTGAGVNNPTVEKIRAGNSNIRNPILVSYVAKGLLPYHGLGSGIKRALEKWPTIDFDDDHDGCLFIATVHRKPVEEQESVNIAPEDLSKPDAMSGKRRESVGKDQVKAQEDQAGTQSATQSATQSDAPVVRLLHELEHGEKSSGEL